MIWALLMLALTVANFVLDLMMRRRMRQFRKLAAETADIGSPEYVRAHAAVICRSFVARLRDLVEKEPPSPTRDRALAVVSTFERAIGRDGRGLS